MMEVVRKTLQLH